MAAQIPTPPASRHSSEAPESPRQKPSVTDSSAELLQSLDTLLERYLCLLDRHQELQADLGKRLSSGFLSLAHANYTCPPGRRYGADYYDERMKAIRKISLQPPSQHEDYDCTESKNESQERVPLADERRIRDTFRIECSRPSSSNSREQTEKNDESGQEKCHSNSEASEGSGTTATETRNTPTASVPPETEPTARPKSQSSKKKCRSSDPITWYGILVPQSLRSAQKSFSEAVEGQVSQLASVIVEMQDVERKVDRLRSEIEGRHSGP